MPCGGVAMPCGGGAMPCGGGAMPCGGGVIPCGGGVMPCGGGVMPCGGEAIPCRGVVILCGGWPIAMGTAEVWGSDMTCPMGRASTPWGDVGDEPLDPCRYGVRGGGPMACFSGWRGPCGAMPIKA